MSEQMRNGDEGDEMVASPVTPTVTPVIYTTTDAGALEKAPEHIPTPEEVHAVFGALMNIGKRDKLVKEDGQPTVLKQTMDDKGLYTLEIEVPGVEEGEKVGYEYRRFAIPDRTDMLVPPPGLPEIHTFYYTDGDCMGGDTAARYVNGEWKPLLHAAWINI